MIVFIDDSGEGLRNMEFIQNRTKVERHFPASLAVRYLLRW
jgi:hypothetical protein